MLTFIWFTDSYRNGINHRGKGTFDPDPDYSMSERDASASGSIYEPNGRVVMLGDDTRPKVMIGWLCCFLVYCPS